MPLLPMHDAGQRQIFFQLLKANVNTDGLESYLLCRLADAEQAHPLTTDMTLLPQALQGIMPSIVLRHHA